ncbi:MAG TPA: 23S rRNA (guanosine(2251)-2'-O)-methyltransferase RlmB [Candidatus Saccharimonadales bacterium]|nr:23S rRNA (guanosine(2251)-2'-O)-methyltransferase RlmB [Candidatus Saccharimonadales bacterium]
MKKNIPGKFTGKSTEKYSDYIYGVHSALEVLQAKRRKVSMVYTTKAPVKSWGQIESLLPKYVQIQFVTRDVLDNISGTTEHQGIVLFVSPFPYEKSMFEPAKYPFLVVLDGVQDVRNLGAIIRSAYVAGVDGIVLCGRNSAPLTPAAIKSSAGLAEHARIFVAPSMGFAMQELKNRGYNIYLATLGAGQNAATVQYKQPAALVIGSEESGISKEVLKYGTRILLPQRRADISYNASVAAGILMFLMGNQFHKIS